MRLDIPRTIGDFLNDFGDWKMKRILYILWEFWLKTIEFDDITINSVGDF